MRKIGCRSHDDQYNVNSETELLTRNVKVDAGDWEGTCWDLLVVEECHLEVHKDSWAFRVLHKSDWRSGAAVECKFVCDQVFLVLQQHRLDVGFLDDLELHYGNPN